MLDPGLQEERRFHVVIDGYLMAENIDEALRKLGQHYLDLYDGKEPSTFIQPTEARVDLDV